jgi:hypothetical protein
MVAVEEEEEEAGIEAVAAEEEEVGVEAATEETSSSDVNRGKGDWRSREQWSREFWDEKQNDTKQTTIYRFNNISSDSLTTTAADSFGIRTEAVLV